MTKTIMKAVGAVAAGRNRKVHMRIASVTIYCDEGSKGSNPATPTKAIDYRWLFCLNLYALRGIKRMLRHPFPF